MRSKLLGPVLALLTGVGIISCSDLITNTTAPMRSARGAAFDATPTPRVVISQVYGAGGNANALYNADFVELYNAGTAAQDLSGWTIQYASATGTGNLGSSASQLVALTGSIQPGQYYLVGMTTTSTTGAVLPTADATGGIAMAAGAGKVALANQATTLGCNSAAGCASAASHIVDLVTYGSTNWTGTTAVGAPTIDATHSDLRKDVCVDTDNMADDFSAVAPNPRNTSTITAVCAGGGGPVIGPLDHVVVSGTATFAAAATTTLTAALQDASGQTISDPAATYTWTSSDETKAKVTATSANTATISGVAAGQANITVTAVSNTVSKTSPNFLVTVTGDAGPNNGTVTSNTIFVSEIHYDNVGTDANEAIEIETPAGADLTGYKLALYDGGSTNPASDRRMYPLGVAPMRIDSIAPTICGNGRQVTVFNFPVNGLQNGSQDGAVPTVPDGWAIIGPDGKPVEFMSYEGTFVAVDGPAANYLSTDIGKSEGSSTSATQSLQRAGNGEWFGPSSNTMGACNPAVPVPPQSIVIQDRPTPLPVGFQTQFFVGTGSKDNHGNTVTNSDVTWSSSAPDIISVDENSGLLTGNKAGQAIITATAKSDGAIGTANVTAAVLPISPTAREGHNTELGTPTDADPSDDIIISRRQYTLSYNASHGGPNWVSWNLDATHKGTAPRCDCFSADPLVKAAGAPAYNTSEWINGGVWSRGHMSPSADWNVSDGDNAPTFYLSNMLPQNQTLNSGAWGDLENKLRDMATGSTEIYIIAGGIFTKGRTNGVDGFGFMNSVGKILVPDSVWKIAIVVPDGRAASGITKKSDVQVIATKFPNAASGTGPYTNYLSTIDAIQKSTGYNFLSALPENVQCAIEERNCAPSAAIAGPTSGSEGETLAFDGAGSSDPDGGQLSYQWTVNGSVAGIQPTLNYLFPQNGEYSVKLVVSDIQGGSSTTETIVSIANVSPVVSSFAGGNVDAGGTYTSSGAFTDPGADTWTGTVNYGDGTSPQTLAINGKSFTLSHKYATVGTFTVTVSISDGLGLGANTAVVTSTNHAPVAHLTGAGLNGGPEGTALSFDASASSDPDAGDMLSYQWTVNGQVAGIGATLSYAFPDNGTYSVGLVVSDLYGGTSTTSANVAISNANPSATFNAPTSVGETSPIALSVSNLGDPSSVDLNAGLKIEFDCGTGSGYSAAGSATSATCPTTEDGVRTVHARITDKDGGATIYAASVAIMNVAPTVTFKAVSPTNIQSGDIVATTGSFTDPGKDAPWTSSIAWGDGQTTPTLPSRLVVSGQQLLGGTQYKKVGTFTATLTITDNDGGAGTASLSYTVSRRGIRGTVDPRIIRLSNSGGDDVTITLVRDLVANMGDLDVSSVKIGSVGVSTKNNGRLDYQVNGNGMSIELTFSKKALMNAGLLTSSTDALTLTGELTNGIQIVSHVDVTTR